MPWNDITVPLPVVAPPPPRTVPPSTLAEVTVPAFALPKRAPTPERAAPERAAPERAAPERAAPERAAPVSVSLPPVMPPAPTALVAPPVAAAVVAPAAAGGLPPQAPAPPPPHRSAAPATTSTKAGRPAPASRSSSSSSPAPTVRLQLVSFFRQWGAATIDALGSLVVVAGLLRLLLLVLDIKVSAQAVVDIIYGDPLRVIPLVIGVAMALLGWQLLSLVLQASPGQRLFGLKIVTKAGAKPSRLRLLVRAVVAALSTLFFFAGPAWGLLVDRRRRGFGDVVAGTVVVRR